MRIHAFAVTVALLSLVLGKSVSMAATKTESGTISGSITASNFTSDACPAVTDARNGIDSYDTICSDPGSCKCLAVKGLGLSGGFGKGTASLLLTVDENAAVTTGSDTNACAPAFGVITLSVPAKGKTAGFEQTLNALGSICGTAETTTLLALGGFSIEASSKNPESSGSGTFNGAGEHDGCSFHQADRFDYQPIVSLQSTVASGNSGYFLLSDFLRRAHQNQTDS